VSHVALSDAQALEVTALTVFDISDDLLGSADEDGYFTVLNAAWERTTGFTREELMSQPWGEFVHPTDREESTVAVAELLATGVSHRLENRFALRDGGWCWLEWRCECRDDQVYFIARDVTSRIEREQRLRLLSNVVEAVDDAILTKTIDGVVTSWNHAAEDLYGYSAAEAIGQVMTSLVVPTDRGEEPAQIVARLLSGEGVRQYATQRCRKDGQRLNVALTASLLRDPDHGVLGVAVVSRDLDDVDLKGRQLHREIDTLAWVGRIRDAIDEQRIVFHPQPIVSLRGAPQSYELLCRMITRDGVEIPPSRFLPVAENYGLIEEIDLLAVQEAARLISLGQAVSINLSTATVGRRHIVDAISAALDAADADPGRLTIEITETAMMKSLADGQRFAAEIVALGCRLSLDDFGTGFGGFTYLKQLPLDQLKIDAEFVRDLRSSRASQQLVEAVVSLADGFGLETVAEGVEDDETLTLLKDFG
jgi:PAS domain S-box-containing protein